MDNGTEPYEIGPGAKIEFFVAGLRQGKNTVRHTAKRNGVGVIMINIIINVETAWFHITIDVCFARFRDAFVSVEITLLDVNDNSPTFVPNNQYAFKTRVNSPPGTPIGKVIM